MIVSIISLIPLQNMITKEAGLLFQVVLNIGVKPYRNWLANFFFGDIASGRLFFIEMADVKPGKQAAIKEWRISINGNQKTFKVLSGNDQRVDLHFGRDALGDLFILTKTDGKVYKIVSASINE